MKPTDEQIKEFWERLGYPTDSGVAEHIPIDLNSLFTFAVPKLQDMGQLVTIYCYEHKGFGVYTHNMFNPLEKPMSRSRGDDLAIALFWAIWEMHDHSTQAKDH